MSDESMIEEFKIEASEMFENAEEGILNIDKGLDFNLNYNSVFRSFHSLKGAAGMFGMDALQSHMHKLESLFEAQKKYGGMKKHQVDYFLKGIDVAKSILDGHMAHFDYISAEDFHLEKDSPAFKANISKEIKEINRDIFVDKKKGIVCVVDDEPEIVDNLSSILEESGIVVYKFYNAKNLLESFESIRPDAIVADIMMPQLNGVEMLEAIRTFSTETPVIFISGYITKSVMLDALRHGAYDFIEKPYNEVTVVATCLNAIKKSRSLVLLERSINYILYQFGAIDQCLIDQGKENIRLSLKAELQIILEHKKILKNL